jgi:deoxyribonuclease-4
VTVKFGPAGFGMPALDGLDKAKKLGLQAAEVEFTYGVRMSNKLAAQVGEKARKLGISLSVHAPYYVNLNSEKASTIKTSKNHILASCERGHYLGASVIVFHPAYYGKKPEKCFENVKKAIIDMQKVIKQKKWKVKLAPETTGKTSQFGSVEELMKLKRQTGCSICVDFAHLYARQQGKLDYNEVFRKLKSAGSLHCHFSGITYGPKGERSHKGVDRQHFMPLAKALKKYKKNAVIICESPFIYHDAVKMMRWFKGR